CGRAPGREARGEPSRARLVGQPRGGGRGGGGGRWVVRQRGFEPPRGCPRQPLKLVRLPVPPLPQSGGRRGAYRTVPGAPRSRSGGRGGLLRGRRRRARALGRRRGLRRGLARGGRAAPRVFRRRLAEVLEGRLLGGRRRGLLGVEEPLVRG